MLSLYSWFSVVQYSVGSNFDTEMPVFSSELTFIRLILSTEDVACYYLLTSIVVQINTYPSSDFLIFPIWF